MAAEERGQLAVARDDLRRGRGHSRRVYPETRLATRRGVVRGVQEPRPRPGQEGVEVGDLDVGRGAVGGERSTRERRREGDAGHPGGARGQDAGGRVLEGEAVLGPRPR